MKALTATMEQVLRQIAAGERVTVGTASSYKALESRGLILTVANEQGFNHSTATDAGRAYLESIDHCTVCGGPNCACEDENGNMP